MKFATLQEEDDYLFAQYVRALKNNFKWYRSASPHIATQMYERFALASYSYIRKLMDELGDENTNDGIPLLMRRVTMALWHESTSALACLKEPYYMRHVATVQTYVESRMSAPKPDTVVNDCAALWIDHSVDPAEDGVYEIENPETPYRRFSMWEDGKWRAYVETAEKATTVKVLSNSIYKHQLRWRPIQSAATITPTLASNLEERTDIMPIDTTKPFVSADYVYGQDTSDMSEAQLLGAIKKIEKEIADLESIKTASTKIASNITGLKTALEKVVAALDAK